MSQTRTSTVQGMSCDHCARSVTEEVSEAAGVDDVSVDLASRRLHVRGTVDDDAIHAAVAAAGFAVAP